MVTAASLGAPATATLASLPTTSRTVRTLLVLSWPHADCFPYRGGRAHSCVKAFLLAGMLPRACRPPKLRLLIIFHEHTRNRLHLRHVIPASLRLTRWCLKRRGGRVPLPVWPDVRGSVAGGQQARLEHLQPAQRAAVARCAPAPGPCLLAPASLSGVAATGARSPMQ